MQFLLSFILFCFINTPLLSADVEGIIDLESRIKGWYTEYKKTAPASTLQLKRSATFVRHLHNQLLQQETEEGVELYSRAILAVIGRGAGIGGLRLPRNDTDKSHLLTPEEKAIVRPALIDAERLRRSDFDWTKDYFGTHANYLQKAGSDHNKLHALDQHADKIQRIALQVIALKDSVNAPELIGNQTARPHIIRAINELNLIQQPRSPQIYEVRERNKDLTWFDILNVAYFKPEAVERILSWEDSYKDIPLVYFVSHGLPDCPQAVREQFQREVYALDENRVATKLLTRDILDITHKKIIAGIKSTRMLDFFLIKYLPETGGALLPQDDLLHIFKIVGRETDNDPQRNAICLAALERFMNAYSTFPLATVIHALISGITYSPADQMTDFYLEAMRMVYQKALELSYTNANAIKLLNPVFQLEFSPRDHPFLMTQLNILKNEILADLLTRDSLGRADKASFASKKWVNAANIAMLTA